MIDIHPILQQPKRGYRKCPFCGLCSHTNFDNCSCGYNWLEDKQTRTTNKKAKSDLSINSHTKYCFCGEVIGKNSLRCKWCRHQFYERKSKLKKTRFKTAIKPQYKTEQEALINYCDRFLYGKSRVILKVQQPKNKCPHKLCGSTRYLVYNWCQKVVDFGLKRGILYLPNALLVWFRQSTCLKNEKKRKKAEKLIYEWCGLGSCTKVAKNR